MFRGMEYVYEVYKEKSFSKAAENLFISQPSLSANVKRVESKIGYPIFDRSTKPLELTECGMHYITAVEQVMAVQREFSDYINDLGGLKIGSLMLGGSNLFTSWILPPLISRFTERYPKIQVGLTEGLSKNLAQLLQEGKIDLLIDNRKLDPDIFEELIYLEEHLLLAVPRAFEENEELKEFQIPMERIREGTYLDMPIVPVPLWKFEKEPFVIQKHENDTGRRARRICEENGLNPKVAFEMDQQMTSYNITCSGMGISFLGDTLISKVPINHDVVYYKLEGAYSRRDISFYWKKGRYLSKTMEAFLKSL